MNEGIFDIFKKTTDTVKKTVKKLKYNDIMYYHENEMKDLTDVEMLEIIKELKPTEHVMKAWFGKYIHFVFKYYSSNEQNKVLEYILDNYDEALTGMNTANYFMLNSFEFDQKELFLKYFDWIVDNISYPFYWERTIVTDAINYNSWWAINKIWEREDKTDWHPLDQQVAATGKSILLTAPTRFNNMENPEIEKFIEKAKTKDAIQEYAVEHLNDDPRWETYISDNVKDMFLF